MIVYLHHKLKNRFLMKHVSIFMLLLFLSSTFVFGQLEKGNCFLAGSNSLGFSSDKYTTTSGGTSTQSSKTTRFNFKSKAGYFLIENLPVGVSIYASTYNTKYTDGGNKNTSTNFTIGPFARYYFLPQDKIRPMAEVGVNVGTSKSKSTYSGSTNESKNGVVEFSLGAGASYFFTDNIAFDAMLSYYSDKYTLKSESHTGGSKSTSGDSGYKYSGIDFHIGVVITIPNK